MKKQFLFPVLIFVILSVIACQSAPQPEQPAPVVEPAPAPTPASTPTQAPTPAPPTPGDTYTRHWSGVILNGAVSHTVRYGDTLAHIARQYYQDGSYYPLIMMVSDDIADPDEIIPNIVLIIPALNVNLNDSMARESIYRSLLETSIIEDQRGRHGSAELMRSHVQ